jgi:Putative MetA-pathway of phenol degradation
MIPCLNGAPGRAVAIAFALTLGATPTAWAQHAPATPAADGAGLQPICADRPTKANGPCTVDAGHFQLEADIVNASFMHASGVTTDSWLVFNPTLKYGLTSNLDIEANIAPLEIIRVKDAAGAAATQSGVSDLFLRLKYEFLNKPSVQAAVIPYVKAPTARSGLGNGAWEGGLIAPVNIKLSSALSLAVQPEVDDLENGAGDGHHLAASQDLSLSLSLPHNLTLFAELWGQWAFDPAATQRQYSADIAAALGLGRDSQLDAGINFGLNRATPGVAPYIGYSHRF